MSDNLKPAKMPAEFLNPEPGSLKDLPRGSEAYINFASVLVDADGSTWVDPATRITVEPTALTVRVKNVEDKAFILTLSSREIKFVPRKLLATTAYRPVIEIIVDESDPLAKLG